MNTVSMKKSILFGLLLSNSFVYAYDPNILSNTLPTETTIYNKNNNVARVVKTAVPLSTEDKTIIKYNKIIKTFNNGSIEEAITGLEEILHDNPSFHPARLKLNQILAKKKQDNGDIDGSLKELNKLTEQELTNEASQQMLAYNYYNLGFYDLAHKYYTQLIRHNSRNSKWWLGLAITQDTVGNTRNAVISYTKAKVIGGLEPEVLKYIEGRINMILTENAKT
jgi:tetratricopeptide (TPR) repeat protein